MKLLNHRLICISKEQKYLFNKINNFNFIIKMEAKKKGKKKFLIKSYRTYRKI
jgi:hypothetical protein